MSDKPDSSASDRFMTQLVVHLSPVVQCQQALLVLPLPSLSPCGNNLVGDPNVVGWRP